MKKIKRRYMRLPSKPSKLIRIAMGDLEKIENNPRYVVQMDMWHTPIRGAKREKICAVCLAGSVIACRSGYSPLIFLHSESLPNRKKMLALNYFRTGSVRDGLSLLGIQGVSPYRFNRDITPYHQDADRFKVDMFRLADDLEGGGL